MADWNKPHWWTESEIEILKNNYETKTDKEMILLLPDRTINSIRGKAKSLSLNKKYKRKRINNFDNTKNLSNCKFGILTALKKVNENEIDCKTVWECKCDCGKIHYAKTNCLLKGNIKSCGCLKNRKGSENPQWRGYEEIGKRFWRRYVNNAKQRGIEFNITIEEIWDLINKQNFICCLSGEEISFKEETASLDRIDSNGGYNLNNIQWVHKDVNKMKMYFNENYFLDLCYLVTNKDCLILKPYEFKEIQHTWNWKGYGNISGYLWQNIQKDKYLIRPTKTIGFNLKIEEAWQLVLEQGYRCKLTGLPLYFAQVNTEKSEASLDRIDSAGNYDLNNVQWVIPKINLIKGELDEKYFKEMCCKITNHKKHNISEEMLGKINEFKYNKSRHRRENRGVFQRGTGWGACICDFYLGGFKTKEEAQHNYDYHYLKLFNNKDNLHFPEYDYTNFVPKKLFVTKRKKRSK